MAGCSEWVQGSRARDYGGVRVDGEMWLAHRWVWVEANGPIPPTSWAYDSTHLLARAIKAAGGTEPEALRKAILSIKGYQGVEGNYAFDENGDGLHGYNVVKNDGGKIVFMKHVEFAPK